MDFYDICEENNVSMVINDSECIGDRYGTNKNYKNKKIYKKIKNFKNNKRVFEDDMKDPVDITLKKYKTRIFWNTKYKTQMNNSKFMGDKVIKRSCNFGNKLYSHQKGTIYNPHEYNINVNVKNAMRGKYRICDDKRCLTCKNADGNQIDQNSIKKFCKTYNCIYLLSCNKCDMRYVGETSGALHKRMNNHRTDSKYYDARNKKYNNRIEIRHFNLHEFKNVKISIIKIVPNYKKRLWYESTFMYNYLTIYPYGLNLKYFNTYVSQTMLNSNSSYIYNNINMSIKSTRKGRSTNKIYKKSTDGISLEKEIENILPKINNNFNKDYKINKIKGYVFGMNKKELRLTKNILNKDTYHNSQAYDICRDMVKYLCNKYGIVENKMDVIQNNEYLILKFMNKAYDNIDINRILNKNKKFFPIKSVGIKKAFKYNITIGRLIFNYNDENAGDVVDHCNCENYNDFVDKDHQHIITGDMEFLKVIGIDETLIKLMEKGTKYRLNITNNKKVIKNQIKMDIDNFIQKIAIKYNIPIEAFKEWLFYVEKDINSIDFSIQRGYLRKDIIDDIKKLQKNYVITYSDKAANNFAIICKKYYLEKLNQIMNSNTNYDLCKITEREIINRIKAKHLQLGYSQNIIKFPYIFIIPKFHKVPVKFRTITSSYNTYNVKVNKKLKMILQDCLDSISNTMILKNSYDLVNKMKDIVIKGVYTWDFEDLFNSIDIEDLLISLNNFYVENNIDNSIDKKNFERLCNLVLRENYILYNGNYYIQKKGILQGAIASNTIANVYLHTYENKRNIDDNTIMFRYIDDLIAFTINNNNIHIKNDFYPSYLNLIATNFNPLRANYLDLNINIIDNKLCTNIYDKRNSFNFNVIKLIHWNSSISKLIFRNIVLNYINRNRKLITYKQEKIDDIKIFFNYAINYDYPIDFLHTYLIENYVLHLKEQ